MAKRKSLTNEPFQTNDPITVTHADDRRRNLSIRHGIVHSIYPRFIVIDFGRYKESFATVPDKSDKVKLHKGSEADYARFMERLKEVLNR